MADESPKPSKLSLSIDFKWIALVLAGVIVAMLVMWRPWQSRGADRTVAVTGQATIKAEPDEYVFSPSFELKGPDQAKLTAAITDTVDETVTALKALGVEDSDIQLNAYGGDDYYYVYPESSGQYRVSATLIVTIDSLELAQKIQDYLGGTKATGQLTPSARFSEAKQTELESQAREQAIADARAKAEQSAGLLDATLGKVLEVSESSGLDVYPLLEGRGAADVAVDSDGAGGLPVLPGQNEFTYSVSVKFAIR